MRPSRADTSVPANVKRLNNCRRRTGRHGLRHGIFPPGSARSIRPGSRVARRFVHLPVNHGYFRFFQVFNIDHPRFLHFVVEIISFTGAFTHTRKYGQTGMLGGNIVDEFPSCLPFCRRRRRRTGRPCHPWQTGRPGRLPLIPVSSNSVVGLRSVNLGASRWILHFSSVLIAPRSSIGWPSTFMMRPQGLLTHRD